MSTSPTLVVAICTRRRVEQLTRLLATLHEQEWPLGSHLLIVDNDPEGSSSKAVLKASEDFPVPVEYVIEPLTGFATVRNRALSLCPSSSTVCFIDDDAVVPPDWLRRMWEASLANPDSLVRSRYAFVQQIPLDLSGLSQVIQELGPIARLGPAGTSGLLLPLRALNGCSFDRFYDLSGGEDIDLIMRLESAGVLSFIADTLALEESRHHATSRAEQRALAHWNGRLIMTIRQRAGLPTFCFRARAFVESASAVLRWGVASALRRVKAAEGFRSLAVGRWASVTAPWKPPVELGRRPPAAGQGPAQQCE